MICYPPCILYAGVFVMLLSAVQCFDKYQIEVALRELFDRDFTLHLRTNHPCPIREKKDTPGDILDGDVHPGIEVAFSLPTSYSFGGNHGHVQSLFLNSYITSDGQNLN